MSRKTDKKSYLDQGIINIFVQSGFGHNTQQPFVELVIHAADWSTQMSPGEARDLAFNLLQCADAAEGDGFLMSFMDKAIGVADRRMQASLLVQFREYREAQRKGRSNRDQQTDQI